MVALSPMIETGSGIRHEEGVFSIAKGAGMFIFPRSIVAPLVALTVSLLVVLLDVVLTVGTP
jgi:hypothetical protein